MKKSSAQNMIKIKICSKEVSQSVLSKGKIKKMMIKGIQIIHEFIFKQYKNEWATRTPIKQVKTWKRTKAGLFKLAG